MAFIGYGIPKKSTSSSTTATPGDPTVLVEHMAGYVFRHNPTTAAEQAAIARRIDTENARRGHTAVVH